MNRSVRMLLMIMGIVLTPMISHAGVARGVDGKLHKFGSDSWVGGAPYHGPSMRFHPIVRPHPIVVMPNRHYLAAKRFCLMTVDNFVRLAKGKLSDEHHARLAHWCSRGDFHAVWRALGGEAGDLTVHEGEVVHAWEKDVREAAQHLKPLDRERAISEIRALAAKVK